MYKIKCDNHLYNFEFNTVKQAKWFATDMLDLVRFKIVRV